MNMLLFLAVAVPLSALPGVLSGRQCERRERNWRPRTAAS